MTIKDWWVNWRPKAESKTNAGPYRSMVPVDIPPKGLGKINLLQRLLKASEESDNKVLEKIDQVYSTVEAKLLVKAKKGDRSAYLDHIINKSDKKSYKRIKEMLKADGVIVGNIEEITW